MGFIRNRLALRLALLFGAIVLGSIAVIFFYVVPQLESSLREKKLRSLQTAARDYSRPVIRAIESQVTAKRLDTAVRSASDQANARVTLLAVGTRGGAPFPYVRSDSTTQRQIHRPPVPGRRRRGRHPPHRHRLGVLQRGPGRRGRAAAALRRELQPRHRLLGAAHRRAVGQRRADPPPDPRRRADRPRRRPDGRLRRRPLADAARAAPRARRREGLARRLLRDDPGRLGDELGQLAMAFNTMQGQLAQLDSARKRFIAVASHELRTPLFSLFGGFVELLQGAATTGHGQEFLGRMLRAAQVDRLTVLATRACCSTSRAWRPARLRLRPVEIDLAGSRAALPASSPGGRATTPRSRSTSRSARSRSPATPSAWPRSFVS